MSLVALTQLPMVELGQVPVDDLRLEIKSAFEDTIYHGIPDSHYEGSKYHVHLNGRNVLVENIKIIRPDGGTMTIPRGLVRMKMEIEIMPVIEGDRFVMFKEDK